MPHSGTGDCSGEIIINAPVENTVVSQFFVSSNTSGKAGLFSISKDSTISYDIFSVDGTDADGIYYDKTADVLYQLNRTKNVINVYSNVLTNMRSGLQPELTSTSTSDFKNGREIAVAGDKLVVAQDADPANGNTNKFIIYTITSSGLTLDRIIDVNINLWGMIFKGGTLYAVVDNSNKLAIYENFFSAGAGTLEPTSIVTVDGLVRTHGIDYIAKEDLMILTDVGDAASAVDGAIFTIENFESKLADGAISLSESRVIKGAATLLGNPVDVSYDTNLEMIFVAERANGGGRVLGFDLRDEGDLSPVYNQVFAGASAIYLDNKTDIGTATNDLDFKAESLTIYPNPAVDRINISWTKEIATNGKATIRIIDLSGRVITTKQVNNNESNLDVSGLSNGLYILSINDETSASSKKFSVIR
ncbi:MAG: T9SS type A sorting domain-containing protein [Saprospiraceae bacterium]|nr:T9SS type A sorting domain-containing protein [Saprospiraceae bacterium]